jgi:hypothetical protein
VRRFIVDSAGVYLPLQDEIFPDKRTFWSLFFRNNAQMSSMEHYKLLL